MSSNTIIIASDTDKQKARAIVGALQTGGKYAVTIEPSRKVRSRDQNALYWKWINIIATNIKHHGVAMTNETWHYALAFMFLEPVIVPCLRSGEDKVFPKSTRSLNKKEFSDYMNKIDEFARDHGVTLPTPEEASKL